jgi:transcriptional regulator with XRE-family HTH domain
MDRMRKKTLQQIRPELLFAQRLRAARERQGLSVRDLAARIKELGITKGYDASMIGRIERADSRATVGHVMVFAAALRVWPIDLITPQEDDAFLVVAPKFKLDGATARSWVRGTHLPDGHDGLTYLGEMPVEERHRVLAPALAGGASPLVRAVMDPTSMERALERFDDHLSDQLAEQADGRRRKKRSRKPREGRDG